MLQGHIDIKNFVEIKVSEQNRTCGTYIHAGQCRAAMVDS